MKPVSESLTLFLFVLQASADGDESDEDDDESEDGMSVSGGDEEEEEEKEDGEGREEAGGDRGGGSTQRSSRGGKANGIRAGAKKGAVAKKWTEKGGGKSKRAKGERGSEGQENGVSADQEPKQKEGKKKGTRNNKQTRKGGKTPPTSVTPTVSGKAEGATVSPPGATETSKVAKSRKSKGQEKGADSSKVEAKEGGGETPPTSAAKRKNKVRRGYPEDDKIRSHQVGDTHARPLLSVGCNRCMIGTREGFGG